MKTTLVRTSRRHTAIAIAAVMLAATAPAAARQSPFAGLHATPDVTTSNDEYQVWIHWSPAKGSLTLPGETRTLRVPEDTRDVWLSVTCRADGTADGYLHGAAPRATLLLPRHPDAPSVPTILNPLYWLRGLTRSGLRRTPISIRWNNEEPSAAILVEPRINYSVPRPGLEVSVRPDRALAALKSTPSTQFRISGPGTRITLRFEPRPELREIAALMRRQCPPAPDGR